MYNNEYCSLHIGDNVISDTDASILFKQLPPLMTILDQEITLVFNNATQSVDDKIFAECMCFLQSQCSRVTDSQADKSICQVYNVEPSDLFWKLEALNYNQSATRSGMSRISMEALNVVKRQLQQGLTKENKSIKKAQPMLATAQVDRSKLPAHMVRGMAQGSGPTAVQNKQERLGDGISTSSDISTTTTVMFHGPKLDQESRKKRACERGSHVDADFNIC
jgi:DNA polymerase alpha subunit B